MCGICGSYDFARGAPPDRELLQAMNASQVHRGPDAEGVWAEGEWKDFDPAKEWVRVPNPSAGRYVIVARYEREGQR